MACCDPREYDDVFTDGYAKRTARRFRTSGLDDTASAMAHFVGRQGLDGATVLEIGGGVGGLHVELLRRGAASAMNLELSTAYDVEAAQLLAEEGMSGRVDRRIANLADAPEEIPVADVVVLHKVVCCYPDYVALLGAAADHARRVLVFSYPRPHLLNRIQTSMENVSYRLRRWQFRTFVHSPEAMSAVVEQHGHTVVHGDRNRMWQFTGCVRGPS